MAIERQKIRNFLNEQIAHAEFRTKAYVFDDSNAKKLQRNIFIKLAGYVDKFMAGDISLRWITMTGLRGAGKTTILSQIFYNLKDRDCYKLFLSLDQTHQILGCSLDEIISVYEDLLGMPLEKLDKPLLLFLDEAQYDPKWAIVLKTIYDRSPKVFIFVTGSSALLMNTNSDLGRRTKYEKLFPLSFSEYLKIKFKKCETKGFANEVRTAILSSADGKQCYSRLRELEKKANQYYLGITGHEFRKYLNYGSLPFMITSDNEAIVYDQISKTLDKVVHSDIASTGNFSPEIVSKIPGMLYAVADMDAFNFSTLSNRFEISRPVVSQIFNLLEHTEILQRIYPYGSHLNQVTRKPSKYLFSSPAFRAMYYKFLGNTITSENAKGKLTEDLVGMYLQRILYKYPGSSLTYDSAQGGADFILMISGRRIVIEVCAGKKSYKQVAFTGQKVSADYSLIISEDTLEHSEELNAVKVPLRLFLLT